MAAGGTSTARPNNPARGTQPSTQQGPRPRILRIGVLLGGKIVEERLIRERVPVTIGQSMKNTFSIPIEGLPLEFTLFALEEGKYYLRFLGKMDGRLSDAGNQVQTLDALKQRGAAQAGDYWQVPLGEASRGKLSFGDLTILFQFVVEPPRAPKPMLPASVRGTFADRIDPRLSVIIGASIVAHFAIALVAWLNDIDEGGLANRAYHLSFQEDKYQVAIQEPIPEPPKDTGSAAAAAGSSAPTPVKQPDKGDNKPNTKPTNTDQGTGRAPTSAPQMTEDDAAALADILSGNGPNAQTEGDMNSHRPAADLGDQIKSVRDGGKTVAIGGGSGRGTRGDGGTRVGTGTGPNINGPTGPVAAGGGKGEETAPTGRISVSDKKTFDETDLSPDAVMSRIQQAYMSQIKHCYTLYLKQDATARGKVKLSLTVNETGRVTDGSASGFNDEVDSCVGNLMHNWTFPKPKDKDGEATEASFALTLQLVPD